MPANSTPTLRSGRIAATALPAYCPVTSDGRQAAAGEPIIGITEAAASAGSRVSVVVDGSAEAWAGAAITDGQPLQVGPNNTVVPYTGGYCIGRALNAAVVGDKVEVLLFCAPVTNNGMPAYIGQVANRCSQQNKQNTTNKQLMSRSRHNAMVPINSLALVFWNGFTDFEGTRLETGGGAATYTASIEYPAGTIAAQITWGGSATKNASDNEVFRSDFANVSIPKGAVFFVRVWRSSSVGIIYNKYGGLLDTEAGTTYSGECFTFSTTTADLTMTPGQFTNIGNTGTGFRPQAIVALTNQPSLVLFGDSRVNNDTQLDTVTDGFGYVGELERSFGMQYPTIKLSQSSERVFQALTRFTYRMQIAAYCSHGVSNYGVNDFRDARSAATVLADQKSFAALFGKPMYVCTVAPMANAGNTVTDATVNPLRTAYNAIIRKGDESFAGTLEIADIVETARDSGLWISGYTSDGLHANTTGSLALHRSGSLRLPI